MIELVRAEMYEVSKDQIDNKMIRFAADENDNFLTSPGSSRTTSTKRECHLIVGYLIVGVNHQSQAK
jgi:hypothetical protein